MAARNEPKNGRPWTPEVVRQRIKTALLVKRLQDQAFGKIEISDSQQKAINILLRKVLPDLQSIDATVKGDREHPLVISSADGRL